MLKWLIIGLVIGTLLSAVQLPQRMKQRELSLLLTFAAIDEVHARESLSDLEKVKEIGEHDLGIKPEKIRSAEVEQCRIDKSSDLLYQCSLKVTLRD